MQTGEIALLKEGYGHRNALVVFAMGSARREHPTARL